MKKIRILEHCTLPYTWHDVMTWMLVVPAVFFRLSL